MVDAREYHERTKHSPESLREGSSAMDPRLKPRPFKRYIDRPQLSLDKIRPPQVAALEAIVQSTAGEHTTDMEHQPIDRETLATLCYEANGIIERATLEDGRAVLFRAASTTGKLYHIDLYLVVGAVDDIDPGLYHFDPHSFGLTLLREGDFRSFVANAAGNFSTSTSATPEGQSSETTVERILEAPVTCICTSTWWRNAWKYQSRTYRHAFWDTGTILANLLACSHALNLPASVVTGFTDSEITTLLGIDPEWEAPIALAPIGSGAATPDETLTHIEPIDPETEPVSTDSHEYPLIAEAWEQSTLADGDAVREWLQAAKDACKQHRVDFGEGNRISLDPVDATTQTQRPLDLTIRRRRSCRNYATDGPSHRQVATVLDRATHGIPGDWNDSEAMGLDYNDCYVLTTGVDGLSDGTYLYMPEIQSLERLGPASFEGKQRLALNQRWAGEAHVNVYLMAAIDSLVDRIGNRGYRIAQLEAGITLGRLYLATYAHRDLGGTGLTFFDDSVTEHCSPRARDQTPTCLYAFGKSA